MIPRTATFCALLVAAPIALAARSGVTAQHDSCKGLPTAPRSQRVDLGQPSFTHPTTVDNPLFPISSLHRVLLLGNEGGVPLRVETTLMSGTRTIDLNGRKVEVLISQYVAWLGHEITEVAIDRYAQDDAGAVWYLGEDVFNYEHGVILDTEGTWLAGRDGPAAMIMPARPLVGNVWRPENVCGIVFEEIAVKAAGVTVNGPLGPVAGAIVTSELHMDGTGEDKSFAPGYGEFSTGSAGGDLEAVELAIPTDALPGPLPIELATLSAGADSVFDLAQAGDWTSAAATLGSMTAAWNAFQSGLVPATLRSQMTVALAALRTSVQNRHGPTARQAAIDIKRVGLDLQLRHRSLSEIDLDLLDLWARQLQVDVATGNRGAALGDAATLTRVRDRLAPDVGPALCLVDAELVELHVAADARNLRAAAVSAERLRSQLGRIRGPAR